MAERTDGLHKAITYPLFYKGLMYALGADRWHRRYVEILDAKPGCRLLDVGCGPANILAYLPPVRYMGIDINPRHIAFAQHRYGPSGTFMVGDVTKIDIDGQFDLINVSGVLHHLDDTDASRLLSHLSRLLERHGRLVTVDPVWIPKQRIIARSLKAMDAGQNIRSAEQYVALFDNSPLELKTKTYHDMMRIPYDHFIVTASLR